MYLPGKKKNWCYFVYSRYMGYLIMSFLRCARREDERNVISFEHTNSYESNLFSATNSSTECINCLAMPTETVAKKFGDGLGLFVPILVHNLFAAFVLGIGKFMIDIFHCHLALMLMSTTVPRAISVKQPLHHSAQIRACDFL